MAVVDDYFEGFVEEQLRLKKEVRKQENPLVALSSLFRCSDVYLLRRL